MGACMLLNHERYDLRSGSFQEGWDNDLLKVRQQKSTKLNKCHTCVLKVMCGMCPANGELEEGDPGKPVDFLCEVSHLRAYALGVDIPEHGECAYCRGGIHYDAIISTADELRILYQITDSYENVSSCIK
jgi:radical SAM protein with 4Fe4S-binding SPASM domain